MSYFLAFAGLENSILATESLSLTTTIEKNMATANPTKDCVSIVNDAKETRYSLSPSGGVMARENKSSV